MQSLGRGEGKQSVLLENSQLNIWGGVAITVVVWLLMTPAYDQGFSFRYG